MIFKKDAEKFSREAEKETITVNKRTLNKDLSFLVVCSLKGTL